MKNFLEELKRLNPKDPGSWPWPVKLMALAALLVAIIVAGAVFDWNDQWDGLQAAQREESKLKEAFLAKKKEAINLDIYKQQLKDIELSFGALLKQLPNRAEMDALIVDINQAGLGRGLQFDLFKPAPKENMSEFYAELPISLRVTGGYHDMGAFASDIAQLPRVVTLNDIKLSPGKEGLVMDAVAKTYRYLDEEEIAKQKPAPKKPAEKPAENPKGGHG